MYKVETNTSGKQLIQRLEGQNATLLYSYGFDCGTNNFNQIDFANDVVRMKSAIVQLNTSDEPIGNPMNASKFNVNIPLSECIDVEGDISLVKLKDLYIEAIEKMQIPVEPVNVEL